MGRKKLSLIIIALAAFCCVADANAQYGAPPPLPGQPERPCGPDSLKGPLRNVIPQGYKGAEFRSACVKHDACYDTLGVDRNVCEKKFRENLLAACDCADAPVRCRMLARFMARNVKRFGQSAFDSAQEIAKKKSCNSCNSCSSCGN